MLVSGHLSGGAGLLKRLKIAETFTLAGIIAQYLASVAVPGVVNADTTSFADAVGLALDTGVYSTTQGDAEGLITVDIRPDAIIKARISGGAAAGTVMTTLSNTAASAAGTVVTDADVGTSTFVYGLLYCLSGANAGQSREVTTFSSGASCTVTVPFLNDIDVGDEFLWAPYAPWGAAATYIANGNLQAGTNLTEADGSIAAGTGAAVAIVEVEFGTAAASYVEFILGDHIYNVYTT